VHLVGVLFNIVIEDARNHKPEKSHYTSEYMSVALVIQHVKRMGRFILSFVACSVLQYFTTLSHERQELRKKIIEHIFFLFSLQPYSKTFLNLENN
jgi:hypothetical protein